MNPYSRQTGNTRIKKDERDEVIAWDSADFSILWSVLSQGMLQAVVSVAHTYCLLRSILSKTCRSLRRNARFAFIVSFETRNA